MSQIEEERAACAELSGLLGQLAEGLDGYLRFDDEDALRKAEAWRAALDRPLPESGIGIESLLEEIKTQLLPNASPIPRPGCTAFITTGAASAGLLAALSAMVAAPQRLGLTAFNYLEELSLRWLAELLELSGMEGVYCGGGSTANILALGAARQAAFEARGRDPAREGVGAPCRLFASAAAHRTVHRAAAVLGMGRESVVAVAVDQAGRMRPDDLLRQIALHSDDGRSVKVAVVANAGATDTGAVDPLDEIGRIARDQGIWFHVDGAYGLPGMLDPACRPLYQGMRHADSTCVDPHKWLGAPVGVGAAFVRDRRILQRAFQQGGADYLEGSASQDEAVHSLDSLGFPYHDASLELSAPCRGVIVWALIREIGRQGLAARVVRHNAMARRVAERARQEAQLELVVEPALSICCFRYRQEGIADLDALNREIHRRLIHRGVNMPSTTRVNGKLVIRPCFIGARTQWRQADALVDEVLETGRALSREIHRLRREEDLQ